MTERSDEAEFVMRCGGGGTHWWTKAHIAYVGVVGLLTSNLDDHQLEEGRSELGVKKTSVFVFVFAYVGETNNMNDPELEGRSQEAWVCDKKSGTLLSPFWWKVPPTTTFHLLCVTKNFGVHLLRL